MLAKPLERLLTLCLLVVSALALALLAGLLQVDNFCPNCESSSTITPSSQHELEAAIARVSPGCQAEVQSAVGRFDSTASGQ